MSNPPEDIDTADLGYFVTTEREDDDIDELAESYYRYINKDRADSRVFYPVCIGEVIDQRYCIEHKLGHGGLSTVWMANDLQNKTTVALKILASGDFAEHEYHMQTEIIRNVQDISHLVTYLQAFLLPGAEEKYNHRVLVFPLLAPCLYDLDVNNKSMATRMSAARQLLEALESLHKAGILHRGE